MVLKVVTEAYSKAEGVSKSKPYFEILPERLWLQDKSKRAFWQRLCDPFWGVLRPEQGVALTPSHSFQPQPWYGCGSPAKHPQQEAPPVNPQAWKQQRYSLCSNPSCLQPYHPALLVFVWVGKIVQNIQCHYCLLCILTGNFYLNYLMINGVLWLTLFNDTEEKNEQTIPDYSNVSTLLVFLWISYISFWGGRCLGVVPLYM